MFLLIPDEEIIGETEMEKAGRTNFFHAKNFFIQSNSGFVQKIMPIEQEIAIFG